MGSIFMDRSNSSFWHVNAAVGCIYSGPSWTDKQKYTSNATLELRRVPADMNNIAKINEHLTKFGTLTNLQVRPCLDQSCYDYFAHGSGVKYCDEYICLSVSLSVC